MKLHSTGILVALSMCLVGSQQPSRAQTSSQNPPQMERPTWKVGDRWIHTAKNPRRGTGRETAVVSKIGEFEGKLAYFIQIDIEWTDPQGLKSHEHYTRIRDLDLATIGTMDDHGRLVDRWNVAWLKWPLVVGAQWDVDGPYEILDRSGWSKRRLTGSVLVRNVETVTTAAQTFDTFHVQGIYRQFDEHGQAVGHVVEDLWMSPEARIWVKYSYLGAFSEEEELVERQPSP